MKHKNQPDGAYILLLALAVIIAFGQTTPVHSKQQIDPASIRFAGQFHLPLPLLAARTTR